MAGANNNPVKKGRYQINPQIRLHRYEPKKPSNELIIARVITFMKEYEKIPISLGKIKGKI